MKLGKISHEIWKLHVNIKGRGLMSGWGEWYIGWTYIGNWGVTRPGELSNLQLPPNAKVSQETMASQEWA